MMISSGKEVMSVYIKRGIIYVREAGREKEKQMDLAEERPKRSRAKIKKKKKKKKRQERLSDRVQWG